MKPERQFFSLEAANSLIPRVGEIVARQLARRTEIEERLKSLAEATGEVPSELTPPAANDPPAVRALKRELLERISAYQDGWGEIEELGGVVKDPRQGLVDFYGRIEGKAVWLCWKYGEAEIGHYHALDEGFASRKPLDTSLKRRMLN
ncbi:MAG TPA: DUF2203 domain-containing protein [Polyangiaceae bacterium]|jgi:hypothetical protein